MTDFQTWLEAKFPSVNKVGKDISISCGLVKKNAFNQVGNNCAEIVGELAKKFGYRPLSYNEITDKIYEYKGWKLFGGSNPFPQRSMASVVVHEDREALGVYHVSFELRGKEYNYGSIDQPVLFRIPLEREIK